jgi:hypothetical protein
MIKIVEQSSTETHSFLMWFVHHSLNAAHSVEVIKIVEQNSFENHSFLMWFVDHSLNAAHSIELIKIVEQNSRENHSFLMWFVDHSLNAAHFVEVIKIVEQSCTENRSFLIGFVHHSQCSTCCRSDQNSWTEFYWESFICNVIFLLSSILRNFLELIEMVQQNSAENYSFLLTYCRNFSNVEHSVDITNMVE